MTTPAAATLRIYQNEEESTTRTTKIPSRSQLLLASVSSEFNAFWYNSIILRSCLHEIVFHRFKVNNIETTVAPYYNIYTMTHTHASRTRTFQHISKGTPTPTRTYTHTPRRTHPHAHVHAPACAHAHAHLHAREHARAHTHRHTDTQRLGQKWGYSAAIWSMPQIRILPQLLCEVLCLPSMLQLTRRALRWSTGHSEYLGSMDGSNSWNIRLGSIREIWFKDDLYMYTCAQKCLVWDLVFLRVHLWGLEGARLGQHQWFDGVSQKFTDPRQLSWKVGASWERRKVARRAMVPMCFLLCAYSASRSVDMCIQETYIWCIWFEPFEWLVKSWQCFELRQTNEAAQKT